MLTSTLLAATLATANPTVGTTNTQLVPLAQYVNHLVQQTVVLTNEEINIDVQTTVLTATHNFNLHGDSPVIHATIQMQDIVQAPTQPVKQEDLAPSITEKATAE